MHVQIGFRLAHGRQRSIVQVRKVTGKKSCRLLFSGTIVICILPLQYLPAHRVCLPQKKDPITLGLDVIDPLPHDATGYLFVGMCGRLMYVSHILLQCGKTRGWAYLLNSGH